MSNTSRNNSRDRTRDHILNHALTSPTLPLLHNDGIKSVSVYVRNIVYRCIDNVDKDELINYDGFLTFYLLTDRWIRLQVSIGDSTFILRPDIFLLTIVPIKLIFKCTNKDKCKLSCWRLHCKVRDNPTNRANAIKYYEEFKNNLHSSYERLYIRQLDHNTTRKLSKYLINKVKCTYSIADTTRYTPSTQSSAIKPSITTEDVSRKRPLSPPRRNNSSSRSPETPRKRIRNSYVRTPPPEAKTMPSLRLPESQRNSREFPRERLATIHPQQRRHSASWSSMNQQTPDSTHSSEDFIKRPAELRGRYEDSSPHQASPALRQLSPAPYCSPIIAPPEPKQDPEIDRFQQALLNPETAKKMHAEIMAAIAELGQKIDCVELAIKSNQSAPLPDNLS